jgi:demethylmenaquinone methyltransferase/2-methoxy-6-polyprenyl-1,4-benzoquinol methylase
MNRDDPHISPVPRTKEEARRNYSRLGRCYDLLEGMWERTYRQAGLRLLSARPGERVLDIGCGTGAALVPLAEAVGPRGKVDGIDISEKMIAVAERRTARAGFADRIELVRGDASELPWNDDTFDAVFMSFTLELFDTPEIPVVLGECRRVLGRDGRTCVVSLSSRAGGEDKPLMQRLYEWGHRNFPKLLDCRPIPSERFLEGAGFEIGNREEYSMAGLPVDVILAFPKRPGGVR